MSCFVPAGEQTKPPEENINKVLSLFLDRHSVDLYSRHAKGLETLIKHNPGGFISFLLLLIIITITITIAILSNLLGYYV